MLKDTRGLSFKKFRYFSRFYFVNWPFNYILIIMSFDKEDLGFENLKINLLN